MDSVLKWLATPVIYNLLLSYVKKNIVDPLFPIALCLSLCSDRVLSGAGLSDGTVDAAQQHDRTGALHTPRIALASAGGPFVIVLALPLCSSFLSVFLSHSLPHRSSLPPPSLPSTSLWNPEGSQLTTSESQNCELFPGGCHVLVPA